MLILEQVRLRNFRSFADTTVAFPPTGFTTVIGRNGAGKSSLVSAALAYCLYGKAPAGVTLKALRRQGAPEGEPVEVSVVLLVDGRRVEITRSMRGKNATSMADITIDGEPVTDTKAGAATELILQLIGPPEAFATVYLVQQKALDALVQAKGADRRKLIERLAGVEKLQSAVDEARAAAREAAAAHDAITVVDVEPLRVSLATAREDEVLLGEALAGAELDEQVCRERLDAASAQVATVEATARGTLARRAEWQRLISDRDHTLDALQAAEARLESAAAALVYADEPTGVVDDTAADRERLAVLRDEKVALSTRLAALPHVTAADVDRIVDFLNATGVTDDDTVIDDVTARGEIAALTAEQAHLAGQLKGLRDTCPTCGQPTDVSGLRATLTQQSDAVAVKLLAAQETLERVRDYNSAVTAGEVLRGELIAARDALTEHETLQTELARVQTDGEALLADITRREAGNAALAQQQVAFERARATQVAHQETLAVFEQAQRTHQHALDAITAFGDEPAVDEDTITAARERETTARGELAAATDVVREARARLAATQRTIAAAEQAVHAAETSEAARSEAATRLRLAVSTRDALTGFREQRLAALAPALQDAASDHVNTLSGGRFTAIELTDDFDTVVVDSDGHARPVAMLSGGEESLVALALRLAIGDEIADGAPGSLLVLDEVLGAMDEDRRVLIVEALRRLDRQVVMVDHHGTPGDVVILVDAGAASVSAT